MQGLSDPQALGRGMEPFPQRAAWWTDEGVGHGKRPSMNTPAVPNKDSTVPRNRAHTLRARSAGWPVALRGPALLRPGQVEGPDSPDAEGPQDCDVTSEVTAKMIAKEGTVHAADGTGKPSTVGKGSHHCRQQEGLARALGAKFTDTPCCVSRGSKWPSHVAQVPLIWRVDGTSGPSLRPPTQAQMWDWGPLSHPPHGPQHMVRLRGPFRGWTSGAPAPLPSVETLHGRRKSPADQEEPSVGRGWCSPHSPPPQLTTAE